jgi:ATP-dependent Lon protease
VVKEHEADLSASEASEDQPRIAVGVEQPQGERKMPQDIPLLPVRDVVVYPFMILPLFVGRDKSIRAVDEALSRERLILLAAQRDAESEEPAPEDLYSVGTVAMIMRMLKMPDGRVKILVQGVSRARVQAFTRRDPYFEVKIGEVTEPEGEGQGLESEALVRSVKEQVQKGVNLGKGVSPDVLVIINNLEHPGRLADLVASNLDLKVEQAQQILEIFDPMERLKRLADLLGKELEVLEMQHKIQSQAREEMDKTHREYYLREQLKAIQKELGETDERGQEIQELEQKVAKAKMPAAVEQEAKTQLGRLSRMHPDAAEASVIRTYLDWLIDLPWAKQTKDNLSIAQAQQILEEDHYDLEKVKERILEYLAVRTLKRKRKKQMKGPILCFVGPPGVGKTSLGRSIARALGRKFLRISLGGVRDEAEIRGHRRTYIGALPGKIIQGIKQAGTNNPVFMMDEVDKVGADFRGDPSAALLEVLDPEQNEAFTDHYLGVPFDLRNVMFITTANLADPIIPALKDRMEVIEISGYTEEEKLHIARRYVLPRQLEENGITGKQLELPDEAILKIIQHHTREAGLRNLEREIATVCRKVARDVAAGQKGLTRVTGSNLHRYLGAPKFLSEPEQERDEVGVATGLAWTQTGGDILYIECTMMRGKGNLSLTGHLGDVMKESAQAAMSYARSRGAELGINPEVFAKHDVHIHVPAGAIPKDGPSAGITMATTLISALTRTPVRRDVAMTGEITLRGNVLPIGGLKEKALAARRMGIKTVIVPAKNDKDVKELPPNVRRGMQFVYVDHMDQVLDAALVKRAAARRTGEGVGRRRDRRPAAQA